MSRQYHSAYRDMRSPLDAQLELLPAEDLRLLIGRLVDHHPELGNEIEIQLDLLRTRPQTATTQATPPEPLDAGPILRAVRATLHSARGYGAAAEVASEVYTYLDEVAVRLEANDGRNALAILEAVTEGVSGGFDIVDDSNNDLGSLYDDLGREWTEAILTAELTKQERTVWATKLRKWQNEVEDYGVDEPFSVAIEATRQGWDDPSLILAMRGELTAQQFWANQGPAGSEALAIARISVLERRGRFEEAINLASAACQAGRVALLLVRMDRVDEAVEYAERELFMPSDVLALGRLLQERHHVEAALTVGEQGLQLEGADAALGRWLRDLALENGRTDLAILAATAAVTARAALDDYKQLQEIAGNRWPQLREEILSELRQSIDYTPSGTVEIYLYEGLFKDALGAVENSYNYDLVARVVEAALPTEPLPAIAICRRHAEDIMNRGKSSHYDDAAAWLARAKAAYRVAGRMDEWHAYLGGLLATHRSKYKLVPMLRALEGP